MLNAKKFNSSILVSLIIFRKQLNKFKKGMHHFSRVNWSTLNYLDLGNYLSMQMTTKLEIKDANIYQELG
jgi:hypothetical protein